jgi:hypothetical protein
VARGIDVPDVTAVYQIGVPPNAEQCKSFVESFSLQVSILICHIQTCTESDGLHGQDAKGVHSFFFLRMSPVS